MCISYLLWKTKSNGFILRKEEKKETRKEKMEILK